MRVRRLLTKNNRIARLIRRIQRLLRVPSLDREHSEYRGSYPVDGRSSRSREILRMFTNLRYHIFPETVGEQWTHSGGVLSAKISPGAHHRSTVKKGLDE